MILVESTLGNISHPIWQERAATGTVDLLVLEQWEAPKSRLRKATGGGIELAISLPRSEHLHDGDVLHYDEAADVIVVARIALKDVLVIELEGIETLSPDEILRTCFELEAVMDWFGGMTHLVEDEDLPQAVSVGRFG